MVDFLSSAIEIAANGLLIVYLLSVAVDVILRGLSLLSPRFVPNARRNQVDMLLGVFVERAPLSMLTQALELPARSLAWPILAPLEMRALRRRTDRQWVARLALKPVDGQLSVFLVALLLIMTGLNYVDLASEFLLGITTWLALIAVVCKELSYVVSPLPDRLKQSNVQPWPLFLVIAIGDAVALTLSLVNLRSLGAEDGDVAVGSYSAFLDLINVPDNISSIFNMNVSEVPVAIVGLLYSTAMIKTLASFPRFKRTEDDYVSLAGRSVMAGDLQDAVKWMSRVKKNDLTVLNVRMQIALASGDFDRAAGYAGPVLVAQEDPDTVDRRLMLMGWYAVLLPLTDEIALAYFRHFLARASDSAAACSLPEFVGEYEQLLPFAREEVSKESAPLTYAMMLALDDNLDTAAVVLEMARPGSEVEEVVRLILLTVIHLARPNTSAEEDSDYLHTWAESSWPLIKTLTPEIGDDTRAVVLAELARLETILILLTAEGDEALFSNGEFDKLRDELHDLMDGLGTPEVVERTRKVFRESLSARLDRV